MSDAREPILNIPAALTALIGVICAIHGLRALLSPMDDQLLVWAFGFLPARYDATLFASSPFPGGAGAKVWTFFTYSLLHADLNHLGFNMLWLLPFGSALARRFGAWRFFLFLIVASACGAVVHLATHSHEQIPMIGASAAISGAMAACMRFAFARGSFLGLGRGEGVDAAYVPASSLVAALQNSRVLTFVIIWFVVNIVFGIGALSMGGETQATAWQAHIGGFLAGLLLFSYFDPVPPQS